MVLTKSSKPSLGSKAPDFNLPATDGNRYSLSSFNDKKVLVIIFTCNHCPYAQFAKPKIHNLHKQFRDKDVRFIAINPNDSDNYPDDSFKKMKKNQYNYPFPYLRDKSQDTARAFGAVCTPDVFVYNQNRELAYRGQINDDQPSLGSVATKMLFKKEMKHKKPSSEDLKDVIQALLNGNILSKNQKPSTGCSIKWKN